MHRGCAAHAGAGPRNRMRHDRRLGNTEPRSTVGFWHRNTEPPPFGNRFYKLIWKVTVLVPSEPIIVTKLATDFCYSFSYGFLLLREFKIHAMLLTLDQLIISLNDAL